MKSPPAELLRRFDLSSPEWVAETPHANVWRVRLRSGGWGALKHYPAGHMGNEASGLTYLERSAHAGAVQVFARSRDAILMEWLAGPSLGDLARTQGVEAADLALATVAKRAFAANVCSEGLSTLAKSVTPVRDACFTSPEAQEAQTLVLPLLAELEHGEAVHVALHGDLHHDNIIETEEGPRFIDAKGMTGPPAYELANAFRHPRGCRTCAADPQSIRRRAILWGDVAGCSAREQLHWAIAKLLLSMLWSGQETPRECAILRQMLHVAKDALPN